MKKKSVNMQRYKHNKTKKNKNTKTYAIVQYDNRKLDKNIEFLTQINKQYCSLYNYDYIFITKKYNISPYWIKVKLVQDILLTNKYKGILWLDTDAVINDFSISLDNIQIPNKSMYYSYAFDWYINEKKYPLTHFNAGVWFVLNDKQGKNIMNDWMLLYNENVWHRVKKNQGIKQSGWECDDCEWSGKEYEQGAFKNIILKYKKYCYQYPYYFLHSSDINRILTNKQCFTYHFFGDYYKKKTLPKYIESKNIIIKK